MKFRNLVLGIGAVALGLGLNSCNLSDDNDFVCVEDYTGALTESEEVMVGKWKLTAIASEKEVDITKDNENNPKKDILAQYSECQRDENYTYGSDRKYTYTIGQNVSECTNKWKSAGTWKLTGKNLSFVGNCSTLNSEIEFNEDKTAYSFTINYNIEDVRGTVVTTNVTFTYSKVVPPTELEPTP